MKKSPRLFLIIIVLFVLGLACTVPGTTTENIDPTSIHETVVAQLTIDYALTQVAGDTSGDSPNQQDVPAEDTPAPADTTSPENTATIEFSATPQETPSPTPSSTQAPTSTSDTPTFGVSVDTNCRTGPGLIYDAKDPLLVGQTAQALGRDSGSNFYYTDRGCWVWTNYAFVVTGNLDNLPIFHAPSDPDTFSTSLGRKMGDNNRNIDW